MTLARIFASLFLLCFALCNSAFADPESGWWWNPNESGRGFFVESHGGLTFIGAYLYDDDGHAKWLVSGGPNADSYNWTGDLYYKTNGQTLFGTYVAPGNAVVVGQLSVHFSDDTHATLTWPGGQVAIEREPFGTGAPAFSPYIGWWWNPNESGSGYSVEVQGSNLFVVGFMYDDSGRPIWYFSAGPMTDATTYHGDVLQFANGQTIGGPYKPPGTPANVATLDIQFVDETHATFTFNGAGALLQAGNDSTTKATADAGHTRTDSLMTQLGVKPSTYSLPTSFTGSIFIEAKQDVVDPEGKLNTIFDVTYTSITFVKDPAHLDRVGRYVSGVSQYVSSYNDVQAVSGGVCTGKAPNAALQNLELTLLVQNYVLTLESADSPAVTLFLPDGWSFTGTDNCTLLGHVFDPVTVTFMPDYADIFEGRVISDLVQGMGTRHGSASGGTVDTQYRFTLQPKR